MDDLFGAAQAQSQVVNPQIQQQQMLMQQQMMQQQASVLPMQQAPIGVVDSYGVVKYSKAQYLEGLRNYVMRGCNYQIAITKEEKIEDIPEQLRHCCSSSLTKIVMLNKLVFNVPETGMSIPFYFCRDCGKLFYYKDFMI